MIHSLFLEVEKRRGSEMPVSVGTAHWRPPALPSLAAFAEDLAYLYGRIEAPYHVHRAYAVVTTDLDVLDVDCDWPLDPPAKVAAELWEKIQELPDVA